jgi:4-hydroxy-3-methylbut-2-enyl diphosphate reductase
MNTTYFQRGFGLKDQVQGHLDADYHSLIVERLRASGHRLRAGDLTFVLAREFGFCYGVERAVEYAYETRRQFPDRRILLTGEIIHNPHVNRRLRGMGIDFLREADGSGPGIESVRPEDVVILPAFGVTVQEMDALRRRGCVLVDTTCGSVLNVWKNVDRFSASGFTALIHGKYAHEETRATASRTSRHPDGRYLVVKNVSEAEVVCGHIRHGGDRGAFLARFASACSEGFDPDRDLERIGLANQTTMLSSESLEIATALRRSIAARYGDELLAEHFASFETICSATQDRQDAVTEMLDQGIDLLLVIGGFNSSNTTHLVEIGKRRVPTYHAQGADDLLTPRWIRHKPLGDTDPVVEGGWLPDDVGTIGITAGASTPNSEIGRAILKILRFRGVPDSYLNQLVTPGVAS